MRYLFLLSAMALASAGRAGGLISTTLFDPVALLSNQSPGPAYTVPTYTGFTFSGATSGVFATPAVSGNGNYWAVRATLAGGANAIVTGFRDVHATYSSFGRVNGPAPINLGTLTICSALGPSVDITNNGRVGFIYTASNAGTITSQSSAFYNAGSFTQLLAAGQPVPGFPTVTVASLDSINFLPNFPNLAIRVSPTGYAVPILAANVLTRHNSVHAAAGGNPAFGPWTNYTSPTPFGSDPVQPLLYTEPNTYQVSNNGSVSGYIGSIASASGQPGPDRVAVVNSQVVLRRGVNLPGGAVVDTTPPFALDVSNAGYVLKGRLSNGGDFVFSHEGFLFGAGSQIVPELSGLNWRSAGTTTEISAAAVNNRGEYAIAGFSNQGSEVDHVIIVRGPKNIIAFTEGDLLDMDGDGFINDQNFTISQVLNESMALDDNLNLTFAVELRSPGNPSPNGTALLRMRLPIPGDTDDTGEVDAADIDYVISQFGGSDADADIDGSLEVDAADIDLVIANFGRTHG